MKKTFSSITPVIAALVLTIASGSLARAQNREKFVISAKAGGVNAITGRAEVRSSRAADWQLLNVTDDLKTGDMVRTGSDGRVEMLLNPGSYLRIAENSEFQLTDDSLNNLEVSLTRGTAIIEATGPDGNDLSISITTPQAKMIIVRRGLYRVKVISGNATELFVKKGRVMLANSHTRVKEGNKVIFSSTTFSVAKLEKTDKQKDSFDEWSKGRAETVALANRHMPISAVNSFLASYDNFWWSRFDAGSSGLWLFNARYGCYTFLPFYGNWSSPYGSFYANAFDCGCYGIDRYSRYPGQYPGTTLAPTGGGPRPIATGGSGSGGGGGGSVGGGVPGPITPVRDLPVQPSRGSDSGPRRPLSP
jgi:FecR protein